MSPKCQEGLPYRICQDARPTRHTAHKSNCNDQKPGALNLFNEPVPKDRNALQKSRASGRKRRDDFSSNEVGPEQDGEGRNLTSQKDHPFYIFPLFSHL